MADRLTPGEKVACRTPAEGKDGKTNIPKWKFDVLRAAIRQVLKGREMGMNALKEAVRDALDENSLKQLGSLGWHLTTVRLELEVRGEIARLPKVTPLRLTWIGA